MEKEKVRDYFTDMIKQSWTYAKMTESERKRIVDMIYSKRTEDCLKGNYKQRWEILQAIYNSFLMGLDYQPIGWRENLEERPLF
jgi:hypothetical protein